MPQRQQQREHADPEESLRPMPIAAGVVLLGMVVFGELYILNNPLIGNSDWGDQRTAAVLRPLASASSSAGAAGSSAGGQDAAAINGAALFAAQCAACHQANGQGLAGVFPPLAKSEWVLGEPKLLMNIVLHGLDGDIEVLGQNYSGNMPAFAQLGDAQLAAILTHLRSSWGNQASAIEAADIAAERSASAGQTSPYAGGAALKALLP
ncbi:MAG: c-type cytochrome [Comamonas sp.]|nr:c-type cytochrome [Comamonas sp.]